MKLPRVPIVWLVACAAMGACSNDAADSRIAELERKVARQDVRQRQLEQRLCTTLDAMSLRMDRIGDALALAAGEAPVSPTVPVRKVAAGEVPPLARGPASPVDATEEGRAVGAPPNPALELAMHRRTVEWVAGCVAVVLVAVVAMRLRSRSRSLVESAARTDEAPDFGSWEEAKVLTDAVAERSPVAGPRESLARSKSAVPSHDEDVGIGDEVIILDPADCEPLAAPVVAPVASPSSPSGPSRTAFHVEAADPAVARAAIEAYLRHDPRVLQKPAPAVRLSEGGLSVECALLPGLAAGEREHLRAVLVRLSATR